MLRKVRGPREDAQVEKIQSRGPVETHAKFHGKVEVPREDAQSHEKVQRGRLFKVVQRGRTISRKIRGPKGRSRSKLTFYTFPVLKKF